MEETGSYRLNLLGPFRLSSPDGTRIPVVSKRGQAMLCMLALSGGGERTRSWLQDRLWGARSPEQGMASLRRELSNLRSIVNIDGHSLLGSDHQRVWIDLGIASVDARALDSTALGASGELLEGLDIAGAEGFEEWLRDERARIALRMAANPPVSATEAASPAAATRDFARLPALAVLAFANQTGDAALDHVAEGMSEDLIDRLANLRWLPVIARGSSLARTVEGETARAAALRLGARYAVEGRLRMVGDQYVLALALIDADDGTQLWSNRSALPAASAHDLIEELLVGLTAVLGDRIEQQQQAIAVKKRDGDAGFHDLIWRGKWHLNRLTKADSAAARDCFAKALALEPNLAEAIVQVAWVRLWDLWVARADDVQTREARKLAQQAVVADCDDARGYMLIGIAESWLRQPLRAEAMLTRAIALNPSLVMARVQLGATHYLRGNPGEAIKHLALALRLSPNDQNLFFTHGEIAQAYLMLGDYEAALQHAEHSQLQRAGYWMPYVIKINALAHLGRITAAQATLAELRQMRPDFTLEFCDWTPFVDSMWNEALRRGLNLAGA